MRIAIAALMVMMDLMVMMAVASHFYPASMTCSPPSLVGLPMNRMVGTQGEFLYYACPAGITLIDKGRGEIECK